MRKSFTYDGVRYHIRGKSEKDIAVKMALKIKEIESGTLVVNSNTLVEKWTDEWLKTYKKGNVGKVTYDMYESIIKNHINTEIGQLRLKDVKPINLQKILNNQKGMSKSHIDKVRMTVEGIFKEAVSNRLIAINPAADLTQPKGTKGKRRKITDKEREQVLILAETHHGGLWVLTMLYCGLRPQEAATLQWKDIDLQEKVLHVTSARETRTNEVKGPKSDAGVRKVPIPEHFISRLKKEQGSPFEHVFTQVTTGRRHTESSMKKMWKNFKRELNIQMGTKVFRNQLVPPFAVADDLVPYCFRHTYCTDLQDAGVPINIAKELMGHEDISTTARIYTHKSEKSFENARQLINGNASDVRHPEIKSHEFNG